MNNSEYHKKHGFQFYLDIYDDENYPIVSDIEITKVRQILNGLADWQSYLHIKRYVVVVVVSF